MTFPARSEAFAGVEIAGLRDQGTIPSIYTLRGPTPYSRDLLSHWKLRNVQVDYPGFYSFSKGAFMLLAWSYRLGYLWKALAFTFKEQPRAGFHSLVLLPRSFYIAHSLTKNGIQNVHLFWGHYPSLVGLAIKGIAPHINVTLSLGAYDLVRNLPLSRFLSKHARLVTHAQGNVQQIADRTGACPSSITVIYRGVQIPDRVSKDSPRAPQNIVCAERLTKTKRTRDVLTAFRYILNSFPSATLTIIGDGPERKDLEIQIKNHQLEHHVTLLGWIEHERITDFLAQATLLISLSQSPGERLPNIVKEAFAVGCPVIVGHTPCIEELVESGINGYIVQPGDTSDAADKAKNILADPSLRDYMSKNAYRTAITTFDIKKTSQQRLELWD